MREILFRGKRIDNGEWVYGSLITAIVSKKNKSINTFIKLQDAVETNLETFVVKPESIGQFTGLLDKSGNEIFEGDKVKFHYFYQGYINGGAIECEKEIDSVIEIRELGLFLKYENEDEGGYLLFYQPHEESFEIIGNIHEENK